MRLRTDSAEKIPHPFYSMVREHRKRCLIFSEGTLEKVRSKDLGEIGESVKWGCRGTERI